MPLELVQVSVEEHQTIAAESVLRCYDMQDATCGQRTVNISLGINASISTGHRTREPMMMSSMHSNLPQGRVSPAGCLRLPRDSVA